MGVRVITDDRPVTVYRNDKTTQSGTKYTTYSLGVSSKNMDGNWVTGFIDCQFKKGVDISHKSKITIANAFYTVSEYNGKKYTKIFVMDYKVVEEGEVDVLISFAVFVVFLLAALICYDIAIAIK